MKYVVYTEIIEESGDIQRWYYGMYNDEHLANEYALGLGHYDNVYHCVCKANEVQELEIKNLPEVLK